MEHKLCLRMESVSESVKQFLEFSTIHGLVYISTNRRLVRLLWLCVVIAGFICSGVMIQQSISSWANNPISTTIETHPISDLDFPNVTVCPARNTFTNLNPDLVMARKVEFDHEKRRELSEHVMDAIMNTNFNAKHLEFSEFKEEKFINWYLGITRIDFPYIDSEGDKNFHLKTTSLNGSFSTAYFKQPFDDNKFQRALQSEVYLYKPIGISNDSKIVIDIENDLGDWGADEWVQVLVYNENHVVEDETMETYYIQKIFPVKDFTQESRPIVRLCL